MSYMPSYGSMNAGVAGLLGQPGALSLMPSPMYSPYSYQDMSSYYDPRPAQSYTPTAEYTRAMTATPPPAPAPAPAPEPVDRYYDDGGDDGDGGDGGDDGGGDDDGGDDGGGDDD
jgi:hypothetical protein